MVIDRRASKRENELTNRKESNEKDQTSSINDEIRTTYLIPTLSRKMPPRSGKIRFGMNIAV
jgi:hypothetical protein